MLVGHLDTVDHAYIGGWAADTDAPESVVHVIIYFDGKRAAQVRADRFRQDLHALGSYGSGNHGFRYELTDPLPLSLLNRISVRFAETGALLGDGNKRFEGTAGLSPILVTAPGRSGTTFLMNRLAQCREICVAETPPYEVRLLAYWSTVSHILTAEANFERSTHPDRLEGDGFNIGSNPFSDPSFANVFRDGNLGAEYFSIFVKQHLHDLARNLIVEYYARIRDDYGKHSACLFAEKNNNLDPRSRDFVRALFGDATEIVLIRDPRDLACSHIAYFKRDCGEAIRQIGAFCADLQRIKRNQTPRTIFIKYEDMVTGQSAHLTRLSSFLGIGEELSGNADDEHAVFATHATSSSPALSIGRWKTDLAADVRNFCNRQWRDFLEEFDYM
jgi:hypothetical protein